VGEHDQETEAAAAQRGAALISGSQIVEMLRGLGVTHVVWLPDSTLGAWEPALEEAQGLELLRVCREGEAWALAAGLHLGGCEPVVVIQNTGLFESGDALRNVLFDLGLPLFALVGYRSYLVPGSADTARRFTEPVLRAWDIDYVLLENQGGLPLVCDHYRACREAGRPGVALVAEGAG
jgi:sulfopyruvate decarboxylase subunit alpha